MGALPVCDVYVFPGDMTSYGRARELSEWRELIQIHMLDQGKKVVAIAGNHEVEVEDSPHASMLIIEPDPANGFFWLHDSVCEIDGFKFFGSPYTPWFHGLAYNVRTEEELQTHWDLIPEGCDVVITHGPPKGILDRTQSGMYVGSSSLADTIAKIKPQLHCFGHIHESYGSKMIGGVTYVNASICTLRYKPINPAPTFTLRRFS